MHFVSLVRSLVSLNALASTNFDRRYCFYTDWFHRRLNIRGGVILERSRARIENSCSLEVVTVTIQASCCRLKKCSHDDANGVSSNCVRLGRRQTAQTHINILSSFANCTITTITYYFVKVTQGNRKNHKIAYSNLSIQS